MLITLLLYGLACSKDNSDKFSGLHKTPSELFRESDTSDPDIIYVGNGYKDEIKEGEFKLLKCYYEHKTKVSCNISINENINPDVSTLVLLDDESQVVAHNRVQLLPSKHMIKIILTEEILLKEIYVSSNPDEKITIEQLPSEPDLETQSDFWLIACSYETRTRFSCSFVGQPDLSKLVLTDTENTVLESESFSVSVIMDRIMIEFDGSDMLATKIRANGNPIDVENLFNLCPQNWLLIPGDPEYETSNFCVMKYEASNDSGVPASKPGESPWVDVSQIEAMSACESLGDNYHLITNKEWMTIGKNIATLNTNWSSGSVGNGTLVRGHTDRMPANFCPADSLDNCAYIEESCTCSEDSEKFSQRRTQFLSNGETIWDLAGNTWEWTSLAVTDKPAPTGDSWFFHGDSEFTDSASLPVNELIPQIAIDNAWTSESHSIGGYNPGEDYILSAVLRGGNHFHSGKAGGLFSMYLRRSPSFASPEYGFRCSMMIQ